MLPQYFQAIGSDRHISEAEVVEAAGPHAELAGAWQLYRSAFDGFCETRVDPVFHRLRHPAWFVGSVALNPTDVVLVVGNGPSAYRELRTLQRVRDRLRIFTSPRGAELLATQGIVPDLVLVEHQTALDAHHTARHVRDGLRESLGSGALVAADWRTPASLLASVRPDRLFVPEPLPTWGLWPATAVAMAADGGARRIGLLGIDLGTTERTDPEFAPLSRLLTLLSRLAAATTFDCGAGGAVKEGWPVQPLEGITGAHALVPLRAVLHAAPAIEARRSAAAEALERLAPVIARARHLLAVALSARAGGPNTRELQEAVLEILSWQRDRAIRVDVQESLGTSFLPRLWRAGIDVSLGAALWRPLALAVHELVNQADRLTADVRRMAA